MAYGFLKQADPTKYGKLLKELNASYANGEDYYPDSMAEMRERLTIHRQIAGVEKDDSVDEREDGMRIEPGRLVPATIETYDDHRMAMSFAIAGLRHGGMRILNPECTSKTYPRFFDDLESLCHGD